MDRGAPDSMALAIVCSVDFRLSASSLWAAHTGSHMPDDHRLGASAGLTCPKTRGERVSERPLFTSGYRGVVARSIWTGWAFPMMAQVAGTRPWVLTGSMPSTSLMGSHWQSLRIRRDVAARVTATRFPTHSLRHRAIATAVNHAAPAVGSLSRRCSTTRRPGRPLINVWTISRACRATTPSRCSNKPASGQCRFPKRQSDVTGHRERSAFFWMSVSRVDCCVNFAPPLLWKPALDEGLRNFDDGHVLDAIESRFGVRVTRDRNLEYQQRIVGRGITVVVLVTTDQSSA